MRKLIGSAVLVTVLAIAPTLASAQRRPAARAAAPRSQQHPSFGVQLDWGNDPNFGIGGRGGVPLHPPLSIRKAHPPTPATSTFPMPASAFKKKQNNSASSQVHVICVLT